MKLTASARLIMQLGEQLIEDELVALLELIKNAYDADANNVDVDINTNVITPYGKWNSIVSTRRITENRRRLWHGLRSHESPE